MATTTILMQRSFPRPIIPTRRLTDDEMNILLDGYDISPSILANPSPDPVDKVRDFLLGQSSEGWSEESIIKCYINTDNESPLENPSATAATLHKVSLVCKGLQVIANDDKIWKKLCDSRWKEKFGYQERMEKAEQALKKRTNDDLTSKTMTPFWKKKFSDTETDAKRSFILPGELCNIRFERRAWTILITELKNVIPSALHMPSMTSEIRLERKEVERRGRIIGHSFMRVGYWLLDHDGERLYLISHEQMNDEKDVPKHLTYFVKRMDNWGWEIRSNCEVWRSVDTGKNMSEVWADYIMNLTREPIPEKVRAKRGGGYASRIAWEIPDNEEIRRLLAWW